MLVAFQNPGDQRIVDFFTEKNYAINEEKLELSKALFFFKSSLYFVQFIAAVIILLAITSIFLAINLMIQKNKQVIQYLYNIGYRIAKISIYYQIVLIASTVVSTLVAILCTMKIRSLYLSQLEELFEMDGSHSVIFTVGIAFLLATIFFFFFQIRLGIAKTVKT